MRFEYQINDNDTVTITGYTGNSKDIVIPSEIEGREVVKIGDSAFFGCSGLTSITIPDSVTSIGDWTFSGCTSLTSVNIPNSVTSIGDMAFYGCRSLISVTIPDSVTRIEGYAFGSCTSLTSVSIPDSVTEIGDYAFYGCASLKSVNIPDSVSFIEGYMFAGCSNLTSITIPGSVTEIGGVAFEYCENLISKKSNYKAFDLRDDELWCRNYEFEENEWSEEIENIELCERGYHFCTNLFEIFNYYCGMFDKDIAIYECEIGDKVVESNTSECVTNKIKPVRRLSRKEIINILNGKEV